MSLLGGFTVRFELATLIYWLSFIVFNTLVLSANEHHLWFVRYFGF